MKTTTASVALHRLHPWTASGAPCLGCGTDLDLHQPDLESPERMLGTCPGCRTWHLIDLGPGEDEAVVALLPGAAALRDALAG